VRNSLLTSGIPLWANHYVASSENAKMVFHSNANKAKVIYNGIDIERYKFNSSVRQHMRNELGISDDTLCVGHIGRFAPQKNHRFLIRVFSELAKRVDSILLLAGTGNLESIIREKTAEFGLSDRVRFLGKRSDTERLYQVFDVCCLPSLFEGFGLAAVEAQCAGLPCVLSDKFPREIICSENVSVLPISNIDIWVRAIMDAKSKRIENGHDYVTKAGFSMGAMAGAFQEFYERML
jgi:glycosyltransferase EpsF